MSPVPEAQYVIVLAKATGWSEHKIRWELPLSRGWAYFHGARLLDGVPMTFPGGTPAEKKWWQGVEERLEQLKQAPSNSTPPL